ncbi:hypothetical protein CRE_17048 [Caenorhabditis remanei]|uniref:SET domain-containing protein n=1 Tax=Caenorhabditis remanei TaxID=31234 RepID=E3M9W3_CAERE|nr:hypothetical protein CRE_17048 [Caenorhabditis remanei]
MRVTDNKFFGRVFTVIGVPFEDVRYSMENFKFVNELVAKLPSGCYAAKVAQIEGVDVSVEYRKIPGIPSKKLYGKIAFDKYGGMKKNPEVKELWEVQAIFKGASEKGRFAVLYQGWKSVHMFDVDADYLMQKYKTLYGITVARNEFVNVLKSKVPDKEKKALIELEQFMTPAFEEEISNRYWVLQDLTYFHSKIQQECGQGNIHYMCFSGPATPLPSYTFVTQHVMQETVLSECIQETRRLDKTTQNKALRNGPSTQPSTQPRATPCENPEWCKCNLVYASMIRHNSFGKKTKLCIPDKMGRLQNLDKHKLGDEYVVVECDSECGCSRNCPRRQLQNGGQKMLVIMCEDEAKGFELVAGENIHAGELIGELVGELFLTPQQEGDPTGSPVAKRSKPNNSSPLDRTLQLKMKDGPFYKTFSVFNPNMAMVSRQIGNAMRFIHHSANPNAVFIETLSRLIHKSPIIPRMAVYASKDIAIGDKITAFFHASSDSVVNSHE